jgi:hypothetical protein
MKRTSNQIKKFNQYSDMWLINIASEVCKISPDIGPEDSNSYVYRYGIGFGNAINNYSD